MLGYTPAEVSAPYIRMVIAINAAVLVLSVVLMIVARTYYLPMLEAIGTGGGSLLTAIAVAIAVMALITAGSHSPPHRHPLAANRLIPQRE